MKKTRAYGLLLAGAILISLTGCGNTTHTTEKESSPPVQVIQTADVTSDTEPCDDITAEGSTPESSVDDSESIPAEKDESAPAQASEPIDTVASTEPVPAKPNTVSPPPAQGEQSGEIPEPSQTETTKPEEPKPIQPVQQQTPAPAETAPAEPKPPVEQSSEEPKEPEFNIDYWISFAKNYAVSIGLELSPTATECWDNPIIAGAHSKYLERDIKDCLNCYKNIEGFTGVWVWAEPDGNGAYKLYIGYE